MHLFPYFNPRTPRGARHATTRGKHFLFKFQSTHPSRGATIWWPVSWRTMIFQSTHPSRGATGGFPSWRTAPTEFQSTHPSRGATITGLGGGLGTLDFNPRTPRGARRGWGQSNDKQSRFQSTHPSRGATGDHGLFQLPFKISIHAPLAGRDCT